MQADAVIVGLGYVGLPLAREAVRAGLSVIGFDVDRRVLEVLQRDRSHIDDVSDEDVAEMRARHFLVSADEHVLGSADTVVVCVPTPLGDDGAPDLTSVCHAMEMVSRRLRPGMLIVLESTSHPGTTDEIVAPILAASGLRPGQDFHLAFSPERIDPGNKQFGVRNTPKVVGGFTKECTRRATKFYSQFIDTVVEAQGTKEAETAKLLENTFRHVNIALVNEMAKFCHELRIDLWDVIRLAATKPFGYQPFFPGPGVGGHCIPIDPNYLSHNVRIRLGYPFRFVELAQEINDSMPSYVAQRAQNILNEEGMAASRSTVLLLGVTYKPDVADQRGAPAAGVFKRLQSLGARVWFHDPFVETWHVNGSSLVRVADLPASLGTADLTILLQDHSDYDFEALAGQASRILDTRGVIPRGANVERM